MSRANLHIIVEAGGLVMPLNFEFGGERLRGEADAHLRLRNP
jgi:hypothetical protein